MKASELRIGNYIQAGTSKELIFGKIASVGDTAYLEFDGFESVNEGMLIRSHEAFFNDGYLHPIPLTEEWLVKFGFEKTVSDGRDAFKKDNLWFSLDGSKWDFWFQDDESGDIFPWGLRPSYVHQLQNLYFALTGDELTIK